MGFTESISSGFTRYADFGARSSRSEYWYWALFTFLGYIAAVIVDAFTTGFVLSMLFAIATFVPSLAVAVRRLHDIDRSGWWMFIAIIPFVGSIVLLIWLVSEGTLGDNRFGEDPTSRSARSCPQCGTENPSGTVFCTDDRRRTGRGGRARHTGANSGAGRHARS